MSDSNNNLHSTQQTYIPEPRIERSGPLLIAGLCQPLDSEAFTRIPQLWQDFTSQWNQLAQRVGEVNYGLCMRADAGAIHYLAGCTLWDFDNLPAALSRFVIPLQDYAVFHHEGHVSTICHTIDAIFDRWLPQARFQLATQQSLHFFERYGEAFDPVTGEGDIEIWVPVLEKT